MDTVVVFGLLYTVVLQGNNAKVVPTLISDIIFMWTIWRAHTIPLLIITNFFELRHSY